MLIFINWAVWIYAVSNDQIIDASFGYFIMPILSVFLGNVFFKEKLNRNQVLGFAVAIFGLSFFYRDQLAAFFDSQGQYNKGVILVLTSALAWATYAISQKKLVSKYAVESLNLFLFGIPAIIVAFLRGPPGNNL